MKLVRLLVALAFATATALPAAAAADGLPDVGLAEVGATGASALAAVADRATGIAVVLETDAGLEVRRLPGGDPAGRGEALRRLRLLDRVRVAELDVPVRAMADPLRSYQWAMDRLEAEDAWAHGNASGQVVAVVDTGVDGAHEDLAGVVLPGYDAFDSQGDGRTDANGHGTHVAGIVAAVSGNGVGVEGLARSAKILPIKVLEDDGSGYSSDVAAGILWAVEQGADVINLSLGSPTNSSVVEQAIAEAIAAGVLVVAASGNEGANGNPVMYPAALDETLSVGAVDESDQRASFSGYGAWLDLVAPGVQIASTMSGQYMYSSGTSMAAPFVSATAALVRKRFPELRPAELSAHLTATAEDLGARGRDNTFGHGIIDTVTALATAPDGVEQQTQAVTRLAGEQDLVAAAVSISRTTFGAAGSAGSAVLARRDAFADSLAGAPLAGRTGPILYTDGGADAPLRAETAAELRRVLVAGGVVSVLGGPGAVSERALADVQALGFQVRRLQGPSRVETALAIADAVAPSPRRVLLARADQWADAVTGGAYAAASGVPLLLTPSNSLHPAVAAWIAAKRPSEVVLLGGESALSAQVAAAVPAKVTRVSGSTRAGTAVAVAERLWNRINGRGGDRWVAVDGWASDSWSPALAAAVLSAREQAPQLLVNGAAPSSPVPPETQSYLSGLGYGPGSSASAWLVGPRTGATTAAVLEDLLS